MVEDAIVVRNLSKSFKHVHAVQDASFSVHRGEVFGFLGPNGAGKTTTIKAMLGLLRMDEGSILLDGVDVAADPKGAKKSVGYLPERVALYPNLTALQNLELFAQVKGVDVEDSRMEITEMGLGDALDRRVGGFSKGMLQRLGMTRALVGDPNILVLDEPAGGLDPRGVVLMREKIERLKKAGKTVFLSSHVLSEVQAVCDRVGIIDHGHVVAVDSVLDLSRRLSMKPKLVLDVEGDVESVGEVLRKIQGVDEVRVLGSMVHVVCAPDVRAFVAKAVLDAGSKVLDLRTMEPSLEEVFMRLTKDGDQ